MCTYIKIENPIPTPTHTMHEQDTLDTVTDGEDIEEVWHMQYNSLDIHTMGNNAWGQLGHTAMIDDLVDLDCPKRIRFFVDSNITDITGVSVGDEHMAVITRCVC
jgi:hypothetical protein